MNPLKRFGLLVAIPAFASFISFIQLSQYLSERTGRALWWVLGFGFAIVAITQLIRVIKESGGGGRQP